LFRFIEWNISPPPIDLTDEEVRGTFNPPDGTTLYPAHDRISSNLLPLVAANATYSMYVHLIQSSSRFFKCIIPSDVALGQGPRRTAFREAIRIMVEKEGYWVRMGDLVVPNASPVTDCGYWRVAGALLALSLLAGDNLHPVSPIVIYTLLSNIQESVRPEASMNLSLSFIQELQSSKAIDLLPWMMIHPDQDWRTLPPGHRAMLLRLVTGFGFDVSRFSIYHFFCQEVTMVLQLQSVSTQSIQNHTRWTEVFVTTAMTGNASFFSMTQFQEMAKGFRKCIEGDPLWVQVGLIPFLNERQLKHWV
jgi:hypothetical protein